MFRDRMLPKQFFNDSDFFNDWFLPDGGRNLIFQDQTGEEVNISFVVPGLEKDQIKVTVDPSTKQLRIRSCKTESKGSEKTSSHCPYFQCSFTVRLPDDVDLSRETKTHHKNGILTLSFRRQTEAKLKEIEIR